VGSGVVGWKVSGWLRLTKLQFSHRRCQTVHIFERHTTENFRQRVFKIFILPSNFPKMRVLDLNCAFWTIIFQQDEAFRQLSDSPKFRGNLPSLTPIPVTTPLLRMRWNCRASAAGVRWIRPWLIHSLPRLAGGRGYATNGRQTTGLEISTKTKLTINLVFSFMWTHSPARISRNHDQIYKNLRSRLHLIIFA